MYGENKMMDGETRPDVFSTLIKGINGSHLTLACTTSEGTWVYNSRQQLDKDDIATLTHRQKLGHKLLGTVTLKRINKNKLIVEDFGF